MKKWVLAVTCIASFASVGCDSASGLEACDIRSKSCQEQVYLSLQQLRGDGWDIYAPMPPVTTTTPARLRSRMKAQAKASADERSTATNGVLQLLKLIPKEISSSEASIESFVENTTAFYSPNDKTVTVVDRGRSTNAKKDTAVLLHEFVHALQDRELGLSFTPKSSDQLFARDALIEGEATLFLFLAQASMKDLSPQRIDWEETYRGLLDEIRQGIVESSAPFYDATGLQYPLGGAYVTGLWLKGGNAAIRHLHAEHPDSFIAYMTAYEHKREPASQASDCDPPAPEGWTAFLRDSFGAQIVYAFMTAAGVDDETAWKQALSWRADRLWGYTDHEQQEAALVWRIRFESARPAAAFIEAISPTDQQHFEQVASEVVISASTSAETLAAWQDATACQKE